MGSRDLTDRIRTLLVLRGVAAVAIALSLAACGSAETATVADGSAPADSSAPADTTPVTPLISPEPAFVQRACTPGNPSPAQHCPGRDAGAA